VLRIILADRGPDDPLRERLSPQGRQRLFTDTAGEPFPWRRVANVEMEMNAQATKLESAENDLKQLMADVSRAMEKAQEAVAKIASKAAAAAPGTDSRQPVTGA
jgi:hypothetical protein